MSPEYGCNGLMSIYSLILSFLMRRPGTSCYVVSRTIPGYIRYSLYPKIMVTDSQNSSPDCVIVYKMESPLQYVPAGFGRVLWYDRWHDQQSLMALKVKS